MTNPIITRRDGAVLHVTLDRPKANAIDLATSRIMGDTFAAFRDDPDLRVAVITGAGDKFFCPGWDLKAANDGDAVDGDYGVGGFGGLQELRGMNKPVIAAVNGIACGGGLELALSADIILAADHATFALPEIRSGTVADAASVKLPKRIPYHIAMELLLTGRWFDATEAHGWGLINHVHPADRLQAAAMGTGAAHRLRPASGLGGDQGNRARRGRFSKFQDSMNRITKRQLGSVDALYASEDQRGRRARLSRKNGTRSGRGVLGLSKLSHQAGLIVIAVALRQHDHRKSAHLSDDRP